MQSHIFDTIAGVVQARGQAGAVAFVMLVWTSMQFFTTLICATNRAWGAERHSWWRLLLKSLILLGILVGAVLLGIALPVLVRMAKAWLSPANDFRSWVYALGSFLVPSLMAFLSLSLFYKLAPRQPTRFAQMWAAALCATALLQVAENLFVIYLGHFATLNAIYGAFGGITALLLWIYLSRRCVTRFPNRDLVPSIQILGFPEHAAQCASFASITVFQRPQDARPIPQITRSPCATECSLPARHSLVARRTCMRLGYLPVAKAARLRPHWGAGSGLETPWLG